MCSCELLWPEKILGPGLASEYGVLHHGQKFPGHLFAEAALVLTARRACSAWEHPHPSEDPTGGADGAHGASRQCCRAVLAGDVSVCYQPWRKQREISLDRAEEEEERVCSMHLGAFVLSASCCSSPRLCLLAPAFKENHLNFVLMQSCRISRTEQVIY